jgi:hypothetical protein
VADMARMGYNFHMIEPDTFLAQEDVALLVQALNSLALGIDAAEDRKHMLVNAGVHLAFRSKLIYEVSPYLFAHKLVAHFRDFRVSGRQPAYHPMVLLLEYLLQTQDLEDQERNLFTLLVRKGHENFGALEARSAVGRIEAPPGEAIGTGVYIGKQLLLTCKHVIQRIFEQGQEQGWVRFGYKMGRYGIETGELFELDIKNFLHNTASSNNVLDYTLVKIIGRPESPAAHLSHYYLCSEQEIRLIHHPRGEHVQISDRGLIVQVDQEFIKHNVEADYGSSGAPIFDLDWHVIALHRGMMALSRPTTPDITEGIPLSSIWNTIKPYLQVS